MVASDRLSAFDVVLDDPIPGKGAVLTSLSLFWMQGEGRHITNHLTDVDVADVVKDPDEAAALQGRALVVKRLKPLPVEAIVRGYVIGSGWKDYLRDGAISGVALPEGLEQAAKLPTPIFTPSSKAEVGTHDENITYRTMCDLVGVEVAEQVRELSLDLYSRAAAYALERGIIIADTKFEFGLNEAGDVVLIDEVLTPDSSRFGLWTSTEPVFRRPVSINNLFVTIWKRSIGTNLRLRPGCLLMCLRRPQQSIKRHNAD